MVTTSGTSVYSQAQSLASSATQQTSLFRSTPSTTPQITAQKVADALQRGDTAGAIGAFVDEKTLKKLTKLQSDATKLDKQIKQKAADNDKKTAQDKVDNAKRQLKALRMRAQLAAAMGDKQAAARIAREAADVAKSLGSAAQEYAGAVKNGATVGATDASGANGGAATAAAGVGSDAAQVQATAAGTGQAQSAAAQPAAAQAATTQATTTAGADATLQTGNAQAAQNGAGQSDKPGTISVSSTDEAAAARKERLDFMGNVRTLMDQARSVYNQAKHVLDRKRKPGDPTDPDHSAQDMADAAKQVDAADQSLAAGDTPAVPQAPTVIATPNNTLLLV